MVRMLYVLYSQMFLLDIWLDNAFVNEMFLIYNPLDTQHTQYCLYSHMFQADIVLNMNLEFHYSLIYKRG